MPPRISQDSSTGSPHQTPTPSSLSRFEDDDDRDLYHEHLHQASVSSRRQGDNNRLRSSPRPWQQQENYTPSPEPQHTTLTQHDGRSVSTTDLSSNNAGKSTPESQQTSNTSYRELERPVDHAQDEDESTDSFYWNSGRSSSDAEDNHTHNGSHMATPGERSSATTSTIQPPKSQKDLPLRSTSLSPVPTATYGASALGFGGPSDWEYFGDYEAEEIDDEELYSKPRPRDSKNGTAELPADQFEERRPELPGSSSDEKPAVPERSLARESKMDVPQVDTTQRPIRSGDGDSNADAASASTQETTPTASSNRPVTQDISSLPRTDLDEVIRAWSDAPYVGLGLGKPEASSQDEESHLETPDVAEASLASTPRERMLGVDVILRDAPEIPKLPTSIDPVTPTRDLLEQTSSMDHDESLPTMDYCGPTFTDHHREPAPATDRHEQIIGVPYSDEGPAGIPEDASEPSRPPSTQRQLILNYTSQDPNLSPPEEDALAERTIFEHSRQSYTSHDDPSPAPAVVLPEQLSEFKQDGAEQESHDLRVSAVTEIVLEHTPAAGANDSLPIVTLPVRATVINVADPSTVEENAVPAGSTEDKAGIPADMAEISDQPNTVQLPVKTLTNLSLPTKGAKHSSVMQRVKELEQKRSGASLREEAKAALSEPSSVKADKSPDNERALKTLTPESEVLPLLQNREKDTIQAYTDQESTKLSSVVPPPLPPPKDNRPKDLPEPPTKNAEEQILYALAETPMAATLERFPYDQQERLGKIESVESSNVPEDITQGDLGVETIHDSDEPDLAMRPAGGDQDELQPKIPEPQNQEDDLQEVNDVPQAQIQPEVLQGASSQEDAATTTQYPAPKEDSDKHIQQAIIGGHSAHPEETLETVDREPEQKIAPTEVQKSIQRPDDSQTTSPQTQPPTTKQLSSTEKIIDPYADLDPWGKASLNRFAAMLREESRAESNKEKLNIFNVFTSRESRLRVVLYGTDDDLIIPPKPEEQKPETKPKLEKSGSIKSAMSVNIQRSLKALPALPTNRDSVVLPPAEVLAPMVVDSGTRAISHPLAQSPTDPVQYSPGGRPIMPRAPGVHTKTSSVNSVVQSATNAQTDEKPSIESSSANLQGPEKSAGAIPRPQKGQSEVKNYLANRKSVVRPYATLTQESIDSSSTFDAIVRQGSTNSTRMVAPTSQYNPASQLKNDDASDTTVKSKAVGTDPPSDVRRFVKADFDPLAAVLPETEATIYEASRLEDLKDVIDAVPDDFSFIHASVVSWDANAKKQREENDRQRHMRQMDSEHKIDSLFDDHEIGYGDISELELEFKQSEAARRADEDRSEYQSFVSDVFNIVWTRLHYELDQLIPHYDRYSTLMNDTLAGKDMFENNKDGLPLAPTMSTFLGLHQKLEIRHQKAFEAVLERDRRLKKTEISPWYTLSNIPKVKQLEKQFEDAEKKAIIEYCQQRDTRANQLMDVLDQNTLRGVGANQDYMEAIMKAVRRIASGRAFNSAPSSNEPTTGLEEVERAKSVTALLATSSEQIVQTFHVADMLLNSADYEVSVAKAKVAKADMGTLAKLKEERAKEDQKLMRDLEHRLALIREDSRRTNDEIIKLMLFLGVQNGRAPMPGMQAAPSDPEHETRMAQALEDAKKRNALKESDEL